MGWARDFGSNQAAEIPEYFVYFGICAVKSWGKRSAQTAKRFFWGRTKKKPALRHRSAGFACLLQAKTLVETINTSTGVNQLLLAGIERVALGADFDSDVLLGRTSGKDIAASAADGSLIVLGMETFLHCCSPLSYQVKGHNALSNFNRLSIIAHSFPECKHYFQFFSFFLRKSTRRFRKCGPSRRLHRWHRCSWCRSRS